MKRKASSIIFAKTVAALFAIVLLQYGIGVAGGRLGTDVVPVSQTITLQAYAGQVHLYLNYASERWTRQDENPPVVLILCAYKDKAVAKYALKGLPNKVIAAEYKLALPDEKLLAEELERTQKMLDNRRLLKEKTDEEAVE